MGEPGVGAFTFEKRQNVAQGLVIGEDFSATFAIKYDQRDAPESLAGNAPVGPIRDHVVNALLAPGGNPFHFGDFGESFFAQVVVIEFDEPLFGGAENHRIMAAPAVRIAVGNFSLADQHVFFSQQLVNQRVGFEYGFAFVLGQTFDEAAFVILRGVSFEAVVLAGAEVIDAVARRGVHDAAALI